jgi:leucyl-tRNA synthetase
VLISPVVDGRFGATAVLGIPEHDHTDAVIAERLGGDLATGASESGTSDAASPTAAPASSPCPAVRYRADDFSVSRQRAWGTPIPIVYCEGCGTVPVPEEQLPVILPLDITPSGEGNPLAEHEAFVNVGCPRCGGPARRETDTLDCHFDALWLWVPACVPPEAREETLPEIFTLGELRHWLPCERVVAGSDSGNFVFDQRTVTKALRDIGQLSFLPDGEPFAGCTFHEMVISEGRKMSKHLGNVVDPDELVERFGADTVRLAVLYAASPQRTLNWSDSAVMRCNRFLNQLWSYCMRFDEASRAEGLDEQAASTPDHATAPGREATGGAAAEAHDGQAARGTEHLRLRLQKWSETAVERITKDMEALEMHSAVRNVMRLLERIRDYEKRVVARRGELGELDRRALVDALLALTQMLAPLAPHVAEELWLVLAGEDDAPQMPWPGVSFRVPA